MRLFPLQSKLRQSSSGGMFFDELERSLGVRRSLISCLSHLVFRRSTAYLTGEVVTVFFLQSDTLTRLRRRSTLCMNPFIAGLHCGVAKFIGSVLSPVLLSN